MQYRGSCYTKEVCGCAAAPALFADAVVAEVKIPPGT